MFGRYIYNSKPSQTKYPKTYRTRQTQFSNSTRIHFISSFSDFSQEEIQATWLTEEDNANIQIDTIKTVKRMRKGKHIDEQEKYSARGLEHMRTADHLEQRKMNKAAVCNAVLAEQRRQRQSGCFDSMRLSAQSRLHSEKSRADALRLGASDAVAAGVPIKTLKENKPLEKNVFTKMISKFRESLEVESNHKNTNM